MQEVTNSLSIPSGSSLWHVDIHGIRPGDLVKYKENGKIGLVIEKSVKESLNKISGYMKEDVVFSEVIKNTISLHRKKETNTLYTLNALNEVVREQNNGVVDPKFSVDWVPHRNTLLVTYKDDETGDQHLRRIETRLISIVNLDEEN